MAFLAESYDVVVIGAGHAGCEAALACARMGQKTLLLTLNMDGVAMMPCNPSIGGTAKGHLVRELDALGGEMGRAIDDTFIQSRMLNTGKGPAVHSLRAQADKKLYQRRMLRALQHQENLTLRQGEAAEITEENGSVTSVMTTTGATYPCRAAILATGVYLKSRVIIGETHADSGPSGLGNAKSLSASLEKLGFPLRRFKTGTPARIDVRTVDFSKFDEQPGDEHIVPFSFLSENLQKEQVSCYLGYTTPETHRIIRENLHRAPLYSGDIHGVGPRYCPSIEDKVVRFADRERHPLFLEPEGLDTTEWYVQGMSSSMPEDVQWRIYRSIPGLENVQLTRLAYAIEYDCIDPTQLRPTLEAKHIQGLFFAGQINGSSGYEEAAAQGIYAGINAALQLRGQEPMILSRADAYIGVLVDDLTGKGTNEPYRMMTSRAEYRLLLRQDNADLRLTEIGWRVGLASQERYDKMCKKREDTEKALAALRTVHIPWQKVNQALHEDAIENGSMRAEDLLRRANVHYADLASVCEELPSLRDEVAEQVEITLKYEGYLQRQMRQVEEFRRTENVKIPENIDYENLYASTASIVYPDADKWKTMFLKDNLNYEESCFETESRNGDRLNAEVYDNELEGFLRLDAEQGLYWKEPLMRYLVQVLHMNGEYGAEDPMDNEAVFRDADDLSGFDRTQAWESACEQMNQLGIEEGNLQYKESYCMHIEDLEEQTQRLLKDGSLSAQDAKESWSKDEEGYLFYFSQTLQGIEIFRYENIRDYPGMYGDMQVYVMKDGLGELQIPVLYSCKLEKKKLSLVSFDKIAEVLEKNYGSVITEEPITVRKCQLVMYPLQKKNGVYDMVPVWICQIGKYQGEGRNESYNYIPINAVTGEEMVELEVE